MSISISILFQFEVIRFLFNITYKTEKTKSLSLDKGKKSENIGLSGPIL